MQTPFPLSDASSLTTDDVITYLLEWQARGYKVVQERRISVTGRAAFTIIGTDPVRDVITVSQNDSRQPGCFEWSIQPGGPSNRRLQNLATDLVSLKRLLEIVAFQRGMSALEKPLTDIRIEYGTPAGNVARCVQMISPTSVVAVWDVYLDDKGVETLLTMRNLGVIYSDQLRLLSSDKKAPKQLTKGFVQDFFKEIGVTKGETRYVPYLQHEHRLLLLADGDVVTLGGSLNNLNINERMHRTADQGDLKSFEEQWMKGAVL